MVSAHPPQLAILPVSSQNLRPARAGLRLLSTTSLAASTSSRGFLSRVQGRLPTPPWLVVPAVSLPVASPVWPGLRDLLDLYSAPIEPPQSVALLWV